VLTFSFDATTVTMSNHLKKKKQTTSEVRCSTFNKKITVHRIITTRQSSELLSLSSQLVIASAM